MRHVLLRLGLTVLGVVGALAVGEVALRLLRPPSDDFWQPHPVLGQAHRPGKSGVHRRSCYAAPVTINAWGFRGPEWTAASPPGISRIVVLGDSTTEAFQVPFAATFTRLLEQQLNQEAHGQRYEVLNLGVSGYGTGQNYLNLVHHGFRFEPKLVLLEFSVVTDVRDDSQLLEGRHDKPYFRLDGDRLILQPFAYPPRYHALKSAIRALQLYQFFGARLATHDWSRRALILFGLTEPLSPEMESEVRRGSAGVFPSVFTVYARQYSPAWKEAWDLTSTLLGRLQAETQARGVRLLVFGIPHSVEIMDPARVEAKYPGFQVSHDVEHPHRMLAAAARRHGFRYVSLDPAFRAGLRRGFEIDDLYLPCDGHLTPTAHRLVAEALFSELRPWLAR